MAAARAPSSRCGCTPRWRPYLAYDLHFQGLGPTTEILTDEDWQLFGLTPDDVRDLLKRLSLQGLLILQSAGEG